MLTSIFSVLVRAVAAVPPDCKPQSDYRARLSRGCVLLLALGLASVSRAQTDTTAPIIAFGAPTATNRAHVGAVSAMSGSVTDAESPVTAVYVNLFKTWTTPPQFWNGTAWVENGVSLPTTLGARSATGARSWSVAAGLPQGAQFPPGLYTERAWCVNSAGLSAQLDLGFYGGQDSTAPTLAINGASGASWSALPTPLSGTLADAGGLHFVNGVQLRLTRGYTGTTQWWNGAAWTNSDAFWTASLGAPDAQGVSAWSLDVPWPSGADLHEGAYSLSARGWDSSGNRADVYVAVKIGASDVSAPTVVISTPADGTYLDSASAPLGTISGSATDGGSGVSYVIVRINRSWNGVEAWWNGGGWGRYADSFATLGAPDASGKREWTLGDKLPPASQMTQGRYTIGVVATDYFGNTKIVYSTLYVTPRDDDAPALAITFPAAGQAVSRLDAIRGSARDDGSGLARVDVTLRRLVPQSTGAPVTQYWNGTSWSASSSGAILPSREESGWTRNQNLPATLPLGAYTIVAQAFDRYNNATTVTREFRVVAPPPLDALVAVGQSPAPGEWVGRDIVSSDASVQSVSSVGEGGAMQSFSVAILKSGGSDDVTLTAVDAPDGWSIAYFDPNNQDISGAMTGAGWTQLMLAGESLRVRVEVTPPAGAPGGARREIVVRARVNSGPETDVVRAVASITAPPSQPDVALSRLNSEGEATAYIGLGQLSPAEQKLDVLTVVGATERFAVQIKNAGQQTTAFRLEMPRLPTGWGFRLFDALQAGNALPLSDEGVFTPPLAPGAIVNWCLELTMGDSTASLEASVPVRVSSGALFDEAEISAQMQGVAGAKYTLDGGKTWETVPPGGLGRAAVEFAGIDGATPERGDSVARRSLRADLEAQGQNARSGHGGRARLLRRSRLPVFFPT